MRPTFETVPRRVARWLRLCLLLAVLAVICGAGAMALSVVAAHP
jgi:hypothetical protein